MKSLPLPALAAALAAVAALPFSAAAAGTLFVTAGLGAVIHLDYVQRCRRVRLPRLAVPAAAVAAPARFPGTEAHRLAA